MWLYARHGLVLAAELVVARRALATLGTVGFGTWAALVAAASLGTFFCGALGETFRKYMSEASGCDHAVTRVFSDAVGLSVALAAGGTVLSLVIGWRLVGSLTLPGHSLAFGLAIVAAVLTVVTVPFESCVIASERNAVFAPIGFCEAGAVVGAVVMARTVSSDWGLVAFAAVQMTGRLLALALLAVRCRRVVRLAGWPRISGVRQMLKFFACCSIRSLATEIKYRGTEMVLCLLVGPLANAAWRVAMNGGSVFAMVIGDLQLAFTPRLMKSRAAGEVRAFRRLVMRAEVMGLMAFSALALPTLAFAPQIVSLWLGADAPPLTVAFLRVFALHFLFDALGAPLHVALTTRRDSSRYQLTVSGIMASGFLFAGLALVGGLPAWCAPAGVALANALAFVYRLCAYRRWDLARDVV